MLGRQIADPDAVESGGSGEGLGLLQVTTVLMREKITEQVEARALHLGGTTAPPARGYLIHMGRTDRHGHRPCFELERKEPSGSGHRDVAERDDAWLDGAVSDDGLVWGTYIHGLFDEPLCRRAWLNRLRIRKGLPAADMEWSQRVNRQRSGAMDRWADHVEQYLDLTPIRALLRQGGTV